MKKYIVLVYAEPGQISQVIHVPSALCENDAVNQTKDWLLKELQRRDKNVTLDDVLQKNHVKAMAVSALYDEIHYV